MRLKLQAAVSIKKQFIIVFKLLCAQNQFSGHCNIFCQFYVSRSDELYTGGCIKGSPSESRESGLASSGLLLGMYYE